MTICPGEPYGLEYLYWKTEKVLKTPEPNRAVDEDNISAEGDEFEKTVQKDNGVFERTIISWKCRYLLKCKLRKIICNIAHTNLML